MFSSTVRNRLHLALGVFLLASPLAAQVPGNDPEVRKGRLTELVGRATEWYLTATKWRDATLARGNMMMMQTQRAIQLRQKYESMSTGELGILGGSVPKWSNYANTCRMSVPSGATRGVTVCNVNSFLQDKYEGVMGDTYRQFADPLFSIAPNIEGDVMTQFGHAGQTAAGFASSNSSNSVFASTTARVPMAVERGQDAVMLDAVAKEMNALIDTLEINETHGKPLSSDQAVQLQSYVDIAKARGSLSRLQNQLSWLRSTAIEAGETIAADRQSPSIGMQVRF